MLISDNILDVGTACLEVLDGVCADIVAEDGKSPCRGHREREADVPLAKDANFCAQITNLWYIGIKNGIKWIISHLFFMIWQ